MKAKKKKTAQLKKSAGKELSRPLQPSERRFIEEYASGFRLSSALSRAGLARGDSSRLTLSALKENPAFARALAIRQEEAAQERVITEERVIDELASIAFADIIDYYDSEGRLRNLEDIPPHARRAIIGLNTHREKRKDDDGNDYYEVKVDGFQLADKLNALDRLGKKLKMFGEHTEIDHNVSVTFRPTDQLISRFVELVRKAGVGDSQPRIETAGVGQQIVDVLPE